MWCKIFLLNKEILKHQKNLIFNTIIQIKMVSKKKWINVDKKLFQFYKKMYWIDFNIYFMIKLQQIQIFKTRIEIMGIIEMIKIIKIYYQLIQ